MLLVNIRNTHKGEVPDKYWNTQIYDRAAKKKEIPYNCIIYKYSWLNVLLQSIKKLP